jgi:hypothetical protein
MSNMTAKPAKAKTAIAILVVSVANWLVFVLSAWNHNLILAILSLAIPLALLFFRSRKMIKILTALEMLIFGILLWNHLIVLIIILFILKVLFNKLRK